MTPTKLLIGQILIVFAIVIAGLWGATQWAAAELGYQPQLGLPWFLLGQLPVYRPWALFGWWYHYEAYAPKVFDRAGMLAAASGFLGCAAAIGGSLWRVCDERNCCPSPQWHQSRAEDGGDNEVVLWPAGGFGSGRVVDDPRPAWST